MDCFKNLPHSTFPNQVGDQVGAEGELRPARGKLLSLVLGNDAALDERCSNNVLVIGAAQLDDSLVLFGANQTAANCSFLKSQFGLGFAGFHSLTLAQFGWLATVVLPSCPHSLIGCLQLGCGCIGDKDNQQIGDPVAGNRE
jgi:hypothetical protein